MAQEQGADVQQVAGAGQLQGGEQQAAFLQYRQAGKSHGDEHAIGQGDTQAGAARDAPASVDRSACDQEEVRAGREQGEEVGEGDDQELLHWGEAALEESLTLPFGAHAVLNNIAGPLPGLLRSPFATQGRSQKVLRTPFNVGAALCRERGAQRPQGLRGCANPDTAPVSPPHGP